MEKAEFHEDSPGRLIRIPEGVHAFIPDALPPQDLKVGTQLATNLAEAAAALGELKGIGGTLPNPHLLIGPLRQREAILSSRLEGTFTTAEELVLAGAHRFKREVRQEVWEVHNYVSALEYGLELMDTLPVSNRLIREAHSRLLRGVRGHDKTPGEFRRHQNFIGKENDIKRARFVPPPVQEMNRCIGELESYLHEQNGLHKLIRLALIHYQFETIHPFIDGNGRIGRLMIVLLLCRWGLLQQPLLYMSPFFERNEDAYRDHLLQVSQSGSWNLWVNFFLQGVVEQCEDAIIRSDKLLKLWEEYRGKIHSPRTSALALRLLDRLFQIVGITTKQAAQFLGITVSAAQRNINKLVDIGILEEVTGGTRDRFYVARGIVEIVDKDKFD